MEIFKTQRGKDLLSYLGYQYIQFRIKDDIIVWRCRENRSNKCHSILKTKNMTIIQEPTLHSHESCPQKIVANKAIFEMKLNIKEEIVATPTEVIGSVVSKLNSDAIPYLPKQTSLTRTLFKNKKLHNLLNPISVNFEVPDKYNNIILFDTGKDDPDRLLVIGNKDLLNELIKADEIYGDGTYDTAPNIPFKLYTWHAKIGNSYPPCVYFLLQKKDYDTYLRIFNILTLLIPDLSPQNIVIDFEKACMNAACITFPLAEIKGSYFHLSKSLIRKIDKVGLRPYFNCEVDTKLELKSLAALAFVPADDVCQVFNQLAATFPNEDNINEVLTYFFFTYIEGAAGRNPKFPIEIWNHYDTDLQKSPKTTNLIEEFHNSLNSLFNFCEPSILKLLDGLKKDLTCHVLTLEKVQTSSIEVKRRKQENLFLEVANLVENYGNMEDKVEYLRSLTNLQ